MPEPDPIQRPQDPRIVWITQYPFFVPPAPQGWTVQHVGPFAEPDDVAPARYVLMLDLTFNAGAGYDPARIAQGVLDRAAAAPERLVVVETATPEVPAGSQHALACETATLAGRPALVVTVPPPAAERADRPKGSEPGTERGKGTGAGFSRAWEGALRLAAAIAAGDRGGVAPDPHAVAFVHAYSSRARGREPYRMSPTGRAIVDALAQGVVVPSVAGLASAVHATPKTVSKTIGELVDALAPDVRAGAEHNSLARLYWLHQQYGAWVRLLHARA